MSAEPVLPRPPARAFDLSGRVALVMGAGVPLGRALAVALAEAGAKVAVAGLRGDAEESFHLHSVTNQIWAAGGEALALDVNVTDPADVLSAVEQVDDTWRRLDILVNAQDLVFAMPFDETGRSEWDLVMAANLTSVALTCRAAAYVMMREGYGRVINLVSALGSRGVANFAAYSAAKGGVLALTRTLAIEWARRGITVNALQIGFYEDQAGIGDVPERRTELARVLPARRLVRSDEVAGAVVMLAADSGFITGEVIAVDAGASQRI